MLRSNSVVLASLFLILEMRLAVAQQSDPNARRPAGVPAVAAALAEAEPPLITKFYDITVLVAPRQQFPFTGSTIGTGQPTVTNQFGGAGGGGFGGGGGQGGGGFFSVNSASTQFGGGGMSGMGGGGEMQPGGGMDAMAGGGGQSASTSEYSLQDYLQSNNGDTVASLIEESVALDTWENNGGRGTIKDLRNTLLIRQTAAIHAEIATFLRELTAAVTGQATYQLEAWWLPLGAADRGQLRQMLADGAGLEELAGTLTTMSEKVSGYHGTLLCRERITTHMASGKQVPVVVGSIPVVGGASSGDQPIVRTLHLGVMLEARLTVVPEFQREPSDHDENVVLDLNFRSSITNRDSRGGEWPEGGKIDRYSMGTHVAEGSCRLRPDRAVLAASLSELASPGATAGGETPELLMVVRVTRVKE